MESRNTHSILVINTGNTSTKVGLFETDRPIIVESIRHSQEDLSPFGEINEQLEYRIRAVESWIARQKAILDGAGAPYPPLSAVSARGGLLKPLASGTYRVCDSMIRDLVKAKRGSHTSNLAAQIGRRIADPLGIPCFIVDPVSVDELCPLARYSGHRLFQRESLIHALNMRRIALRFAAETGRPYETLTLIVVHMGSGVSLSVHHGGRMIDIVNPSEEGPFSPDRSGGLPIRQLVKHVLDNGMGYEDFSKMVFGDGGIYSYLGTRDFAPVADRYRAGEPEVVEVVQAMAYQVSKETAGRAAVVNGAVDAILLTGGMAHAEFLTSLIADRVRFIAPVFLRPGEDEMAALAEGAFRVLAGDEEVRSY